MFYKHFKDKDLEKMSPEQLDEVASEILGDHKRGAKPSREYPHLSESQRQRRLAREVLLSQMPWQRISAYPDSDGFHKMRPRATKRRTRPVDHTENW